MAFMGSRKKWKKVDLLPVGLEPVADGDRWEGDVPDLGRDGVEGDEHGPLVPLLDDAVAQKDSG